MSALLIDGKLRFIHVPKTGGTWITNVIESSGIRAKLLTDHMYDGKALKHGRAQELDYPKVPSFMIFRHPDEWWQSVWHNRMEHWAKDPENPMDLAGPDLTLFAKLDEVRILDLNKWLESIIERDLTHLWWSVYYDPQDPAFIGDTKTLYESLRRALDAAKIRYSLKRLERFRNQKINETKVVQTIDSKIAHKIIRLELEAIHTLLDPFAYNRVNEFVKHMQRHQSYRPIEPIPKDLEFLFTEESLQKFKEHQDEASRTSPDRSVGDRRDPTE